MIRLIETNLGRWMLVVAVINDDAYPFLQTWSITLRIQEQVLSGCTVPPDIKETEFKSNNHNDSP